MPQFSPLDEPFFRDRLCRRDAHPHRSLRRARVVARHLGLDPPRFAKDGPPVLAVVGSKGKGTCAIYASAVLAAAGMRVGTLTSPGLRHNRERIRVNGECLSDADYQELSATLDRALLHAAPALPDDGYLSPSDAFCLTAVRHFLDTKCDVLVLEAGMGGAGDEISLFPATAVAITEIFEEHVERLGPRVEDIAREKCGVIARSTRAVVALPQREEVTAVLDEVVQQHEGGLRVIYDAPASDLGRLPPDLIGLNAGLGILAAQNLLTALAKPTVGVGVLQDVLDTVQLPARRSVHWRQGQQWVVDGAINGAGAAATARWCVARYGKPATVLVRATREHRAAEVARALVELDLTVRPLRAAAGHLRLTPWERGLPAWDEIDVNALGPRVLALGTSLFVGSVLDFLGAETDHAFVSPEGPDSR